jgi:cell division protein ZapE
MERDPAQLAALETLDRLARDLTRPAPVRAALGVLSLLRRKAASNVLRGVYLWGNVGRGKTTLMDLFFDAASVQRKRRVHFHAFMSEVHDRLHRTRRNGNGGGDPVSQVAQELARETRLVCFDEFSVSDIADATILARLFSELFAAGVIVVATSNVEPRRLYEGGRNRDQFLPFIDLLLEHMEVVHLDARADFRMEKKCVGEVYFKTTDPQARSAAQAQLTAHMGAGAFAPTSLHIKGRKIEIPQAHGKIARFNFSQICGRPLGAADYLALTKSFDIIIVDDVPAMNFDRRNEAKRFMTLVDVLYDAKIKLILSAEAEPGDLYRSEQGAEALEFPRTVSRLIEMRSRQYLEDWLTRCS